MLPALLRTKLNLPALREQTVARPRLFDRLDGSLRAGRLTLVCAPAGFGKTTVVRQWLAHRAAADRIAWLALDEADADPARFFAYLIAAAQTVEPGVGQAALSLVKAAAGGAAVGWGREPMAALINELAETPAPLLCVLDDYQHITNPPDS